MSPRPRERERTLASARVLHAVVPGRRRGTRHGDAGGRLRRARRRGRHARGAAGRSIPPRPVRPDPRVRPARPAVAASLAPLAGYLRRQPPSAMLSALPHANVTAILARGLSASRSTRLVLSEHPAASLVAQTQSGIVPFSPYFMRQLYPRASAVVAVSDGVTEDLAHFLGLDRARITRIYNPIFLPASVARAEGVTPHPWFEPGQPPVLIGAGRLTAQKDFETLMRAFALVRSVRSARLLILGQGEQRPQLLALADRLGVGADVALPGFVADLYTYLERASVFVLSSRWEGFGNVLVEAMACGIPVVSTDCPSGPREILEGGRHGLLVPVADPPALARAIECQLDRPMRDSLLAGHAISASKSRSTSTRKCSSCEAGSYPEIGAHRLPRPVRAALRQPGAPAAIGSRRNRRSRRSMPSFQKPYTISAAMIGERMGS